MKKGQKVTMVLPPYDNTTPLEHKGEYTVVGTTTAPCCGRQGVHLDIDVLISD